MGKDSIISFSEQSKYALADKLLNLLYTGKSWSDYVLFGDFCTDTTSYIDIDYHQRRQLIDDLQNKYELLVVNNHSVTLTKRGEVVAKMGIENYNRKIEEDIRKEEENKRLLESQKEKKKKKDNLWNRIKIITGVLVALCTIYTTLKSCNENDKKENVELKE